MWKCIIISFNPHSGPVKYTESILPIWQRRKLKFPAKEWPNQDSDTDLDLNFTSHHTTAPSSPGAELLCPFSTHKCLRHLLRVKTWSTKAATSFSPGLWGFIRFYSRTHLWNICLLESIFLTLSAQSLTLFPNDTYSHLHLHISSDTELPTQWSCPLLRALLT